MGEEKAPRALPAPLLDPLKGLSAPGAQGAGGHHMAGAG